MKAVWCDPLNGSWPAWEKFRKYGITRVYVDAREITEAGMPPGERLRVLVDGIHSQGFEAGIYRQPSWGGWTTAVDYAALASKDIKKAETDLAAVTTSKQIAYMHDFETHDIQWILAAMHAWRKPRPLRTTDVTWEPFQGGLWGQDNAEALLSLLVAGGPGGVYHQNYYGGMEPAVAERVRADLIVRGFPDTRLWSFYDGKYVPPAWDGAIFTADRLAA